MPLWWLNIPIIYGHKNPGTVFTSPFCWNWGYINCSWFYWFCCIHNQAYGSQSQNPFGEVAMAGNLTQRFQQHNGDSTKGFGITSWENGLPHLLGCKLNNSSASLVSRNPKKCQFPAWNPLPKPHFVKLSKFEACCKIDGFTTVKLEYLPCHNCNFGWLNPHFYLSNHMFVLINPDLLLVKSQ